MFKLKLIIGRAGIEPATSCFQVRNATDFAMSYGPRLLSLEKEFFSLLSSGKVKTNLVCNSLKILFVFNSLPKDKILDCSKLKKITDD